MKTELRNITPAQARIWLKRNENNRPLRPGVVDGLHIAYARGEWKVTHQGVGFARSGRLLDGQHRLTFISQLPEGISVPMNVTTDMDDDVFGAIDQGFKRTASDVLGVSADLSAVGRFFARIANGSQATGMTIQFCAPFIEWVTPEFEELVTYCPTKALIWSSAPMRAAAVYQMKRGHDEDFIKTAYHALVHADIDAMPNAARVLMQQRMSGKIVSARSFDLFCRALRAFDSRQTAKITKILVKDMSGTIEDVREFVLSQTKKSPTSAGQRVAKPVVDFKAKRRA